MLICLVSQPVTLLNRDRKLRSKVIVIRILSGTTLTIVKASECVSEHGKAACADLGGQCITEQDGYYIVSAICLAIGILTVVFYMIPTARKLQGMFFIVPIYLL